MIRYPWHLRGKWACHFVVFEFCGSTSNSKNPFVSRFVNKLRRMMDDNKDKDVEELGDYMRRLLARVVEKVRLLFTQC